MEMGSRFLGVGLKTAILIALFTIVFSVILKVIFAKYYVKGVSEVIQAS